MYNNIVVKEALDKLTPVLIKVDEINQKKLHEKIFITGAIFW